MEPARNPNEVISYTLFYKMTSSERERKLTTKSRDEQTAIIQSVLPGKTYHFRVVGNSNHGPGESSNIFELTTQPDENIAGAVKNVFGQALSQKEIHVRWTPPLISNGNISKYRVYYTEPDGVDLYVDSIGADTEVILTELHPLTQYAIYVVSVNENGMVDSSKEITVKTFSSIPGESPLNVTLEATSSTCDGNHRHQKSKMVKLPVTKFDIANKRNMFKSKQRQPMCDTMSYVDWTKSRCIR
ncbi:neogenin-like [Contarinia nasturtii]|uniref:neogenin-like n=1 Tax=Contarinia nasturtii TaxID=265458 RepID=UPI0012D46A67|nr:neogenin-like [Contarinia nasturtii]